MTDSPEQKLKDRAGRFAQSVVVDMMGQVPDYKRILICSSVPAVCHRPTIRKKLVAELIDAAETEYRRLFSQNESRAAPPFAFNDHPVQLLWTCDTMEPAERVIALLYETLLRHGGHRDAFVIDGEKNGSVVGFLQWTE